MFPTLYSNRSAAHLKVNDGKAALTDAKIAVAMRPAWGKGHMRLGGAHAVLGELDEAVKAYRRACELEPANREYTAALSNARSRATALRGTRANQPPQPPPPQQARAQAQAGPGLGEQLSQAAAQAVVWLGAHHLEVLKGVAVLVALFVLSGGGGGGGVLGDNLGSVVLIGGAVYSELTADWFAAVRALLHRTSNAALRRFVSAGSGPSCGNVAVADHDAR